MQRRTVLRTCGAAVTLGLAGCGGNGDSGNGDGSSNSGNGDGSEDTPTETQTTVGPPSMGEASLTAGASECLSGEEAASVTFDGGVVVEGTVSAPNPCHAPQLGGASYDPATDTLSLTVAAVDDSEEGTMCASCVGGLEYRVTVPFENGLPGAVTVIHDGTEEDVVADVTR